MEETRRRPGAGGGARGKGSRSGEGPAARRKEAAAAGSAAAMKAVAGLVRARSSVKWMVMGTRYPNTRRVLPDIKAGME